MSEAATQPGSGGAAGPLVTTIECGETLDVARVAAFRDQLQETLRLHRQLGAAMEGGHEVVLAADRLTRIDAAALQLLVAYFHAARGAKLSVRWASTPEPLRRAAALLGLSDELTFNDRH